MHDGDAWKTLANYGSRVSSLSRDLHHNSTTEDEVMKMARCIHLKPSMQLLPAFCKGNSRYAALFL